MTTIKSDPAWGLMLEALELKIGAPVLVRTRNEGVTAGILAAAAEDKVALKPAVPVWSWSGTGGTGSVHDLAEAPTVQIRRSAIRPWLVITEVASIQPLSPERYQEICDAPTS